MKKSVLSLVVAVALLVPQAGMHAISTAQSFYEKARQAALKSKSLQAAIKFVQRKPLTGEEKAILKKMTFTAAVVAIVAAVTGVTVANTKKRLSTVEQFAAEKPFDPQATHLALLLKQAKEQGISFQASGPIAALSNKAFITAIVTKDDNDMRAFFCNAKNDANTVDLNAAEFGLKQARSNGYELGQLVAEYISNRIKARDANSEIDRSRASITVRRLETTIQEKFAVECR